MKCDIKKGGKKRNDAIFLLLQILSSVSLKLYNTLLNYILENYNADIYLHCETGGTPLK